MAQHWDLILPSHAKINLGLYVLAKRQDGYHNIWTIFQELEFHDTVYFSSRSPGPALTTSDPFLPTDDRNLVYQAVHLLTRTKACPDRIRIHIEKQIPLGGGLGGGSSNAATTLIGLNRLFGLGLSLEELASLGVQLGSDVPFFLYGGTALATGRGENIQPLPDFPKTWILLINPGIHVSSGWAYKNVNLKLTNSEDIIRLTSHLNNVGLTGAFAASLQNLLEEPVMRKYPLLRSIKAQLYDMGAEWAMMSGSGSTIFGVFKEKHIAENTLRRMERPGWLSVVTGTLQRRSFDKPVSMYPSPQD